MGRHSQGQSDHERRGQRTTRRRHGGGAPADADAQQPLEDQESDGHRQRPLEQLSVDRHLPIGVLVLGKLLKLLIVQIDHPLSLRAQGHVYATRGCGNILEHVGIQMRSDEVTRRVFDKLVASRTVRNRNEFTGLGTDSDREDHHTLLRRRLGREQRIAAQILAVGDQDHDLLRVPPHRERRLAQANGRGDIRAAQRDGVGVQCLQRFAEGVIVGCHGCLQKRLTGECHEAHAVPIEPIQEILDRQLRPCEPIRLHIRRQHRTGGINRKQNIQPAPLGLLHAHRTQRPRQCDAGGDDHQAEHDPSEPQQRPRHRKQRRIGFPRERKGLQAPPLQLVEAPIHQQQQWHCDEADHQPQWLRDMSHGRHAGIRRRSVNRDRRLNPRTTSAAIAGQSNSSSQRSKLWTLKEVFSSLSISS